ncbi:MAG: hypothetical protein KDD52_08105 [Bdellovibrionales bacterium]|nr:hypothetical protein [Bdellovibrionales bacterium]
MLFLIKVISNNQIDDIGNLLKREENLSESKLKLLLEWRNSFSPILEYYYKKLHTDIDRADVIVLARRLKRIDSIQKKLKRFKTMRLSTIQDIAGVRAVFKNEIALMSAYSKLRGQSTKNKMRRFDDYHSRPKLDGYRGMHFVYQNVDSMMIEVQLRTELEHIWATAVEIYGELQETSFKTGEGDQGWKNFFLLLSSYFAIKENSTPCKEHEKYSEKQISSKLKKAIKQLRVIEKLNASTNGIQVVVSTYNESGKTGKYAIVELDLKNQMTTVEIFNKKDVKKAIEIYTKKELSLKKEEKKNIVFVNIESLEKIQQSYPNYFLDTQRLLEILSKIVLNEY